MKILIAEDDLTSQVMLESLLTKWEYKVTVTDNGQQAYDVLQEDDAPSIALLDWEMPHLDGAALCKMLREQKQKRPIYLILLTSRRGSEFISQGLLAGADDYISKPYDNNELKARIEVGTRMLQLQNQMIEQNKLEGVLEMAGAVCHELNQPLQTVSGYSELLLMDLDPDDPNYMMIKNIKAGINRIAELTRKIMNITKYQSKPYMHGKIVDLEPSSKHL
ncbi:putative transcriptional regulatory (plasmid) [Desulforapulum autotrophicum HRM2]|uniref:histidine kinase n=1 Tax=Desulforapulum autotrophicum (strain ATCC 43914 / DSM 3382 / VKM B-1955 / HRM2) TaxID=177437 RepID=C0QMN3_DESAH|nr:response regulator [Desulforapulum autotrophicum]ACN18027.1 putative transcriptional regulatory [Desulforapulum autotrophicum HRM2]